MEVSRGRVARPPSGYADSSIKDYQDSPKRPLSPTPQNLETRDNVTSPRAGESQKEKEKADKENLLSPRSDGLSRENLSFFSGATWKLKNPKTRAKHKRIQSTKFEASSLDSIRREERNENAPELQTTEDADRKIKVMSFLLFSFYFYPLFFL